MWSRAPYGQIGDYEGTKWKAGVRYTEICLDGLCEGILGQQRDDCGDSRTFREG